MTSKNVQRYFRNPDLNCVLCCAQSGELRTSANLFNPFTLKSAKFKPGLKILNAILQNYQKETAPLERTAR